MNENIQEVLDELHTVRPEMLDEKGKRLFEAIMKIADERDEFKQEVERLNKKIEQYENPEDMTLMFMWCNEKAKDEIKRLNNIISELEKELEKDFHTFMCNSREVGKTYKAGGNAYREHILLRLRELKGSDKE